MNKNPIKIYWNDLNHQAQENIKESLKEQIISSNSDLIEELVQEKIDMREKRFGVKTDKVLHKAWIDDMRNLIIDEKIMDYININFELTLSL